MLRTVGLIIGGAILGSAIAVAATLVVDRDNAEAPQPDRVVGIIEKCTAGKNGQTIDLEGEPYCGSSVQANAASQGGAIVNVRLELTIRTDKGTTYTVSTAPTTNVNVGDPWPKQ